MKNIIASVICLAMLLCACAPQDVVPTSYRGKYRSFTVLLHPNTGTGLLEVLSGNQGCTHGAGQKQGCVMFDKGTLGTITFALTGPRAGASCASNPTAPWVITQVQLSERADSNDSEKGEFGRSQPAWLAEAFPGTDLSDGVIYAADLNEAASTVGIFDRNDHEGARIVYYQVTATKCGDASQVLAIDPMVENRGR